MQSKIMSKQPTQCSEEPLCPFGGFVSIGSASGFPLRGPRDEGPGSEGLGPGDEGQG